MALVCTSDVDTVKGAIPVEPNVTLGPDAVGRRMPPVVIAMWGSRARVPTLGFLGWFGPRGLASIVFAVIVVEESQLPHEHLIVLAVYLTVGASRLRVPTVGIRRSA